MEKVGILHEIQAFMCLDLHRNRGVLGRETGTMELVWAIQWFSF